MQQGLHPLTFPQDPSPPSPHPFHTHFMPFSSHAAPLRQPQTEAACSINNASRPLPDHPFPPSPHPCPTHFMPLSSHDSPLGQHKIEAAAASAMHSPPSPSLDPPLSPHPQSFSHSLHASVLP